MTRTLRSPSLLGLAAAAVLAGAAATVAAVVRRRAGGHAAPGRRHVACACGQRFEVSGLDRHSVYWREGAPDADPVLGEQCPACGRPLPVSSP